MSNPLDPYNSFDPLRSEVIEVREAIKFLTGFAFIAVVELGVIIWLLARSG